MSQTLGAPRRLWDTKAPPTSALARLKAGLTENRINTIGTLKLDFAAQKKGHGRLGRVETGLLARTLPIVTKEHANAHRRCLQLVEPTDRRDALCPSPKIQMHKLLLV